jgi:chemosensory pili system protein ChpA (sensor histidine kinase/response regulator)
MTTVFIVEDNVALGNFYKKVLESAGLDVIQAKSCEEAYERLEEVVPSAMLLDLTLPDGDGFEIVDYMKARSQFDDTRIAVVSGNERPENKKARPIETYLHKPVSTVTLLYTVQELTGRSLYS